MSDDPARTELELIRAFEIGRGWPVSEIRSIIGKYPEAIREKGDYEYTALHLALIGGASDNVLEVLLDAWPESIHEYSWHKNMCCDCCTESILHVLAKTKYRTVSTLRLLVERDESIVDAPSWYDHSVPLHAFASRLDSTYDDDLDLDESLDFVRFLVERRPDSMLERELRNGRTPVHCAALSPREYAPVVEYLAQQSPESLLLKDSEGRLPVHLAADCNDAAYDDWRENLEVLVEQCPESLRVGDNDGNLAIHLVVTSGWGPGAVRLLVDKDPGTVLERNNEGRTPLHLLSFSLPGRFVEVARIFIETRPDVLEVGDHEGLLPLHLAASCGDGCIQLLWLLSEARPDTCMIPALDGRLPLHCAAVCAESSLEVTQSLLEDHPEAVLERNNEGRTPLHLLILSYPSHLVSDDREFATSRIEDKHEVARILIETRSDVQVVGDHEGRLPLHLAASCGDGWIQLLRILVEARPDTCMIPAIRDGQLPLHCAASCAESSLEVTQCLLEHHPDEAMVATINPQRQLPVHSALAAANDDTISWLLPLVKLLVDAAPESLHVRDGNGQIPLQVAASNPSTPLDVLWYLMTECPTSVSVLRGRRLVR